MRNLSHATQLVQLTGRFGRAPIDFGAQAIPARASATFTRQLVVQTAEAVVARAAEPLRRAARPRRPRRAERRATPAAGYSLRTGIRTLAVNSSGQLVLNGSTVVHFRGVALHEDTLANGPVMSHADRQRDRSR